MKNKKQKYIVLVISSILFFLSLTLAQQAGIRIRHVGYGETTKEAYFTIHNNGDFLITNIAIFVDGKEYRTQKGQLAPKKGFEIMLYLEQGEHLIEVSTPEGAYDSLNITIPTVKEKPTKGEVLTSLEENKLWIGLVTLIVIFVIGIWLLTKKPKLKF